ncbi:MAG: M23 family metallopeptidase [Spirochaetia bacterium]|nr:M23 family metallopeptidase [Spirochaetia bacterium]
MEWKYLSNKSKKNLKKIFLTKLFNIKKIRFKYLGSGQFYYSYPKRNFIKTGSLKLNNTAKLRLAAFLGGCILFTYIQFTYLSNENNTVIESSTGGIGGIGQINASDELTNLKSLTSEQIAESERLKDELLSDAVENETEPEDDANSPYKISYTVQEGDTLSHISAKFNVSVEAIAGSSGISHPDDLRLGQALQIPSKEGFFYEVKKGDRLANIIDKYEISPEKFLKTNNIINPDLLEEGDEIFLPDAKPKNLIHAWLVPVTSRYVTSGYGWRKYPRKAFHKGLDFKAAYTSVRSTKAGTVTFSGWLGGYGKAIVIRHPGGYKTLYAHLSKIYVKKGQSVSRGRIIGITGDTGYSFGPHLHFEVSRQGRNINPRMILRGLRGRR